MVVASTDSPNELVKKYQNGVIPAKAGIQNTRAAPQPSYWIPAFGTFQKYLSGKALDKFEQIC